MPQRFLKPGLTRSMHFNSCSFAAQSLFVRLIDEVDDYARFDAHPVMLARLLFPFGLPSGRPVQEIQLRDWLDELAAKNMILLYTVAQRHYLHILRWTERIRTRFISPFPAPPPGSCGCRACKMGVGTQIDNNCCQMPATDNNCCQPTANAASPTSTSTSTSTSTQEEEGARRFFAGEVPASTAKYAALKARVDSGTARQARGELSEAEQVTLKKMRADLDELQKKQARGDFTP